MRQFISRCLFILALAASATLTPQKETILSAGKPRTYYTLLPEKITTPVPLLLLLRGSGRDGMSQIDAWKDLAEKERILLVAPDSANSRNWVFGTDGPKFLHDVIEAVRSRYSVDGRRIYIFGHSAGATFALYMGITQPEYFAAVAVHAGAVKEEYHPLPAKAARKLPIAIWVGTKDQSYSLDLVRGAREELNKRGFDARVTEMEGHDHDYYAVAAELNPKVWKFLMESKLENGK